MARTTVIAALLLATASPAYAEDARPPAPLAGETRRPSNDVEYEALVKRGLAEYDLGHFTEAKAFFLRAHQRRPSARTLRGVGLAAYELRSYVEAIAYLRQALANQERALSAEMRAEVETTLEEAKSFVAHDKLELEPRDARVQVDGLAAVFDDDGSLLLDPGQHEIRCEAEGFEAQARSVTVRGGEHAELRLELSKPAAAPALLAPEPARTTKQQSSDNSSTWSSLGTQRTVGLSLAAASAGALGVGTVFAILAAKQNGASKDNCPHDLCDARGFDQRNGALAKADVATVAFIAGGALLAAGAVVYFTAPAKTAVAIELAPGIAGIAARGQW